MSTVSVGSAAAIGVIAASPLLLPLAAGVAAWSIISSCINNKAAFENEAQKNERLKEERKNYLLSISDKITREMTALIDAVSDANERKNLKSQFHTISNKLQADIETYKEVAPDALFREIRQKILSVQMDEQMARSQNDEFKMIESLLNGKIPSGFLPEWNEIQTEMKKTNALTLQNKIKSLAALLARTRAFAKKTALASNISLTGLVEEKYTIPIRTFDSENKGCEKNEKSEKLASFLADIADFGARVAFFDENEARKLRPLIDEATSETTRADEFRLSAIRDEIKMRYGKLKEQKILTEIFKDELRGTLPLIKRMRGAETLIARMEDMLAASEIPRGEFMPLYGDIKILLADQLDRITDEAVAEKVGGVLSEMGYTLVGEDGENLTAREVNFIESPYEGYQVKVKVDKGGTLSTRLVRVVGSEGEKNSASEYQRQKDIEIGRKWCKDLGAFHERMRSQGLEFKATFRKEPEEQPLDVVVRADSANKKKERGLQRLMSKNV